MSGKSLQISVPGKLFIAGEYAVLDGCPAIVIAVNRYMRGTISASIENQLSLPDLGLESISWSYTNDKVHFRTPSKRLGFVKNALEISLQFIREKGLTINPFTLRITSELDDPSGKKYGLGSSAATVVTTITAILHFFMEEDPSKELVFKLASLAHFKTQGSGSCADIAASTYGGWLHYSMFDRDWLLKEIASEKSVTEMILQTWPGLDIHQLPPPNNLYLCVGWTGEKASTPSMVRKIEHLKQYSLTDYQQFLQTSMEAVETMTTGFREQNHHLIMLGLKQNRAALKRLGEWTKVAIETEELENMISIANKYGVGKTSGAGGGDCGIAFVYDQATKERLLGEWKKHNIQPLDLAVTFAGATVKRAE